MCSQPKAKLALMIFVLLVPVARCQQLSGSERSLAEAMLEQVASDVRHEYYDARLHGLDWSALVLQARSKVANAPDMAAANAEIAALLESLNDSHTFFVPPRYASSVDYGWKFQIIGDRCYVTEVRPGSDAAKKGMRPGDEVVAINGFTIDRDNVARMQYAMNVLRPRNVLRLQLRDFAGSVRPFDVEPATHSNEPRSGLGNNSSDLVWHRIRGEGESDRLRPQYKELGPDLMILRLPAFLQTGSDIDALFKKAREHKTLIIDLRGTPGGLEVSLLGYLGGVFAHDFKACDLVSRKKKRHLSVKSNLPNFFSGTLTVLIDSQTASAGEIFARVVQLQHRGTILGDRSSGQVMSAEHIAHLMTSNVTFAYADSITVADMIMPDGKSLERIGVTPDRVRLPTRTDLLNKLDPVLSFAALSAGVTLSSEDAWKLFQKR